MAAAVSEPLDHRGDAYRVAVIHSRRVRRLKILLPILAIVISLAFIAVSWVRSMIPDNLTIVGAKIENGMIVMEKPAISGLNLEGLSYYMAASRALQSIRNPNQIKLEDIKAALPMDGRVIAEFAASSAAFDRATDRLDLTEPFSIDLSSGISARFQAAFVDVRAGILMTDRPVDITARGAHLVADSFEITDKGRRIALTGHVKVTVNPKSVRYQNSVTP